jgi:hypothetical protein
VSRRMARPDPLLATQEAQKGDATGGRKRMEREAK